MPVKFSASGNIKDFEDEIAAILSLEGASVGTVVPDEPHHGPRASKSGLSAHDLFVINEFGTDQTVVPIPARPVFGPAMDRNRDAYGDLTDDALRGYRRRGGNLGALRSELASLGEMMVQDVLDQWAEQDVQALAQSTIDRKGHDIAWEETGELLESVDYVVQVRANPTRGKNGVAAFRNTRGRFTKAGK